MKKELGGQKREDKRKKMRIKKSERKKCVRKNTDAR